MADVGQARRWLFADAHADSLMWNRDLTLDSEEGHVDLPRLRAAGVRLQCFTVVTRGLPFINGFPLFAGWRRWPRQARRGEWARTLWQIDRLEGFCDRSAGAAKVVGTRAELEAAIEAGQVAAVLGIEGGHALQGQVARVEELWRRKVRFMSLTHLGNNELGGSSFPWMGNRRLTPHGQEVLEEMARVGMAVDVSHASERTLQGLLAHPTARLMCSHTGIRSAAGNWRNLPDEALRAIADRGGVVGVIFAPMYLGGRGVGDVARHIERAWEVMGEDGVALGSDFDGMVPLPDGMRDVRDLYLIGDELARRGHPEARIDKALLGNWRRFFGELMGG
jgi:membrane dipeptidase